MHMASRDQTHITPSLPRETVASNTHMQTTNPKPTVLTPILAVGSSKPVDEEGGGAKDGSESNVVSERETEGERKRQYDGDGALAVKTSGHPTSPHRVSDAVEESNARSGTDNSETRQLAPVTGASKQPVINEARGLDDRSEPLNVGLGAPTEDKGGQSELGQVLLGREFVDDHLLPEETVEPNERCSTETTKIASVIGATAGEDQSQPNVVSEGQEECRLGDQDEEQDGNSSYQDEEGEPVQDEE
ncbi:hypothetical protein MD484_g7916, partial [Candolleomyces efflorescens]